MLVWLLIVLLNSVAIFDFVVVFGCLMFCLFEYSDVVLLSGFVV